jgi:hypothetical protein
MQELLTKRIEEMSMDEALVAAKLGRMSFDRERSSPSSVAAYDALPSKEELLKQIEAEIAAEQAAKSDH